MRTNILSITGFVLSLAAPSLALAQATGGAAAPPPATTEPATTPPPATTEPTAAPPAVKFLAVEVGPVIGLNINTSPLGLGPDLGLEVGVRVHAGPGFFGVHLRGAYERYEFNGSGTLACMPSMGAPNSPCISSNMGMYTFHFLEETLTIGLPLSYRLFDDSKIHPYIQIQPQLVFMRGIATTYNLTNTETGALSRGFGILGALGIQYDVGPGGVWLEAGYRYVQAGNATTAGQNATISVIAISIGYRLAF